MNYSYYYNDVPGEGLQRNNLIYTSLMSDDGKKFIQWYYNDGVYHKGQNEVVDPALMKEKFDREVKYLSVMHKNCPNLIPNFYADVGEMKVYLDVDGKDFWNRASCSVENYSKVIPDWEQQILDIMQAHKNLGLYKYSLHPSSYFVIDGKLKSMNYFFTYHESEGPIKISDHASHIHSNRQNIMREQVEAMGISWDEPESLNTLQHLCFESFRKNYTDSFINQAKEIYT